MSLRTLKLQTLGLAICGSAILLMLISFLGLPDDRTSVEYIHRPMLSTIKNTSSKDDASCTHTNQGKFLIVDDKGMVCPREEMNLFGCCNTTNTDRMPYSCETCDEKSHCCSAYEYCVSCCLNPVDNQFLEKRKDSSFRKTLTKGQMWLWALEDDFEFCTAQCRTSSRTVIHQNTFKSPLKHCYGPSGPSFTNDGVDRHEKRELESEQSTKNKKAQTVVHHDDIDHKNNEHIQVELLDKGVKTKINYDVTDAKTTSVDLVQDTTERETKDEEVVVEKQSVASDEVLDKISEGVVKTDDKSDTRSDTSDTTSDELMDILARLKRVEEEKKALEEENRRLKDRAANSDVDTTGSNQKITTTSAGDTNEVVIDASSHDTEHQYVYDQSVQINGSAKPSHAVNSKFIRFSYYMMYIVTAFTIWLSYYWDMV
eukprot:TRINITY_DN1727_c0_g1_i1.p1 TRINITY_DN1727_c0_g1~~TRINITY_DN1727_c0_g1_i1.p1  ORF type:complete len:446 (-),score=93.71 TRINITY_DN1727_c0_g1_i1:73-1353(-)